MLTVGGLLLGAVLTTPGATPEGPTSLVDPFAGDVPRVAIAHGDQALGLRDPFGPDRRRKGPSMLSASRSADLRDPFSASGRVSMPISSDTKQAGLPSPFSRPRPKRPTARRRAATPDLRDPFDR